MAPIVDPMPSSWTKYEMITLIVGPARRAFHISQEVLAKHIPKLRVQLDEQMRVPVDMTMIPRRRPLPTSAGPLLELHLHHIQQAPFEVIVDYIHLGRLPPSFLSFFLPATSARSRSILEVYALAEELCMTELVAEIEMQVVLNIDTAHRLWTFSDLVMLDENNLNNTQLYDLILRSCVEHFMKTTNMVTRDSMDDSINFLTGYPKVMKDVLLNINTYKRFENSQ